MIPEDKPTFIDCDQEMKEITHLVDLKAYIYQSEKEKFDGSKEIIDNIVLRVYKEGIYEGIGLKLAPDMSKRLVENLRDNGINL